MTDAEILALACRWFDCEQPDPTIEGDTSYHRASRGEHKRLEAFLAAALRDAAKPTREAWAAFRRLLREEFDRRGIPSNPAWTDKDFVSAIERLVADAEARGAEKAAKLLRDLTPGGSEFQTPEECAAHVRQERSGMLDTIKKFKRMADGAEARGRREGEQRERELREALEKIIVRAELIAPDSLDQATGLDAIRGECRVALARSTAQPEPDHLPPCCCHCEHGASVDVECSECATLATRGISTSRQPAQPPAPETEHHCGKQPGACESECEPEPVLPLGHAFKGCWHVPGDCPKPGACHATMPSGPVWCPDPESAHKPSAR